MLDYIGRAEGFGFLPNIIRVVGLCQKWIICLSRCYDISMILMSLCHLACLFNFFKSVQYYWNILAGWRIQLMQTMFGLENHIQGNKQYPNQHLALLNTISGQIAFLRCKQEVVVVVWAITNWRTKQSAERPLHHKIR